MSCGPWCCELMSILVHTDLKNECMKSVASEQTHRWFSGASLEANPMWRPSLWRSLRAHHAGVIANQIGLNVGTLIWVANRNAFKCKCVYFRYVPQCLRCRQGSRSTRLFCFLSAWFNAKCVLVLVSVFLTHMSSGFQRVLHHGRICSGKNRYKCLKPGMLGYTQLGGTLRHKGSQCD